jgi:hypothetical protein
LIHVNLLTISVSTCSLGFFFSITDPSLEQIANAAANAAQNAGMPSSSIERIQPVV